MQCLTSTPTERVINRRRGVFTSYCGPALDLSLTHLPEDGCNQTVGYKIKGPSLPHRSCADIRRLRVVLPTNRGPSMTHKWRKIEHSLRRKRILFKDEGVRVAVNNGGLTGSVSRLRQRVWRSALYKKCLSSYLIVRLMGNVVVWVSVCNSSVKGNVVVMLQSSSLTHLSLATETWERSLDPSTLQLFIVSAYMTLIERGSVCFYMSEGEGGGTHDFLLLD